jgi:hypothetical protein
MIIKRILFIILVFCLGFISCRKDDQFFVGQGKLELSQDTVYFDTVFTKLPGTNYPRSITKRMMVRNPFKESIKFNVKIMGGNASAYRMNIDGRTGRNIPEVEILPKDSAWLFVEATLEPNNLTQPALVRDSIEFERNGQLQYIQLAAYGWDAYYYNDSLISGTTNWVLNDKPYVIVNTVFVDKGATLNIGPGIHVYSSTNSTIINSNKTINVAALNIFGTLKVNGTASNPVIFEGDRLDNAFQDKAGQWRGLHIWRGSINNEIKHAIIKNATIGIQIDSLPESGTHSLIMRNTIIKNISAYGILGLTAKLYIENSVISNCGINTFVGYLGGDYVILNSSLYTSANGRKDPHVIFNNALRDENKVVLKNYDIKYAIVNSIIWGPVETEINFDFVTPPSAVLLSHSIYKSKASLDALGPNNKRNIDPKFIDASKSNLKLNTNSPAKDAADSSNAPNTDLDDKARDSNPDIGAYEL